MGNSKQPEPQTAELRNKRGDRLRVMNLGGIIREWDIDMGEEEPVNILLGYPHWHSYLHDTAYHGAIAGRYCNRIARSRFSLNGKTYQLDSNEGNNHLHGGSDGFHRRLWELLERGDSHLLLGLTSDDGDQGYPGKLDVSVRYTLEDDGTLAIDWEASTDADTVVSLTSHGYFNLAGCGDALDHYLRIPADNYTPVDTLMIPTGAVRSVAGSALDLRHFRRVADVLATEAEEIQACDGLDHNWALEVTAEPTVCAELISPRTNLRLTVSSTLPGLQCYTGNHLMANGVHGCHEGICLEPQYYPDSPNQPGFPSPVLRAGQTMRHSIRYRVDHVDAAALLPQPEKKVPPR